MEGDIDVPKLVGPIEDEPAAQALIEWIADEHDFLSEDDLKSMNPGVRRRIEKKLRKLHDLAGYSVITVAKNLYSSNARFIFELLQNADDNNYTNAREEPYISFHVYRKRIVIDCNEDGFTRENLVSICGMGKSSKTGTQGYIGEKGIGFKSVFMVAYRGVHIQSGHLSFYFQHRNGESGMGMITPIWKVEPEAPPTRPRGTTRITLFLHDRGNSATLERNKASIEKEFRQLHDTVLLFLKKLKRIDVSFYNDLDHLDRSVSYTSGDQKPSLFPTLDYPPGTRKIVRKAVRNGEPEPDTTKYFQVTTHQATRLAKSEMRNYTSSNQDNRVDSESQVILAFPLTPDSVPTDEEQHFYAFLPVQPMEFRFIVHADFVTDASRQGIVTESQRNRDLLQGIAEAFMKGILNLCSHPKLKYTWVRYLPRQDINWGSYWSQLVKKIAVGLTTTPILLGEELSSAKSLMPFGGNNSDFPGTAAIAFTPTLEEECGKTFMYQNILFMETYRRFSLEELRVMDYDQGRCKASGHALPEPGGLWGLAAGKYSSWTSNLESRPAGGGLFQTRGSGPLMDSGSPDRGTKLRRISELCCDYALDRHQQPLFADKVPGYYISQRYDEKDIQVLKGFGLRSWGWTEIIDLVQFDLAQPVSRLKFWFALDDWYKRAADLLNEPFRDGNQAAISKLRELPLIPLCDGRWITATSGPIYYPDVQSLRIPDGLGLQILDPRALTVESRKILFENLGVQEVPISMVRKRILDKWTRGPELLFLREFELGVNAAHLKFLYQSEFLEESETFKEGILVGLENQRLVYPFKLNVYLKTTDPYGPFELLRKTPPGKGPGDGAPGFMADFLHPLYCQNPPSTPQGSNLSWNEWLHDRIGIKRDLPVFDFDWLRLSASALYIAEHRPEKFLGFLRHAWNDKYTEAVKGEKHLLNAILDCNVLCRGNRKHHLAKSFFPRQDLEEQVARYLSEDEFFPWLKVDTRAASTSYPTAWKGLIEALRLDQRTSPVPFSLAVLHALVWAIPPAKDNERPPLDFEPSDQESRRFFDHNHAIYIPERKRPGPAWVLSRECLWEAPGLMTTKYPLRSLYSPYIDRAEVDASFLTGFFTKTLGLVNSCWKDYIIELSALKEAGCKDFDQINQIYEALSADRSADRSTEPTRMEEIRNRFAENALIFCPSVHGRDWHRVSDCLWASPTEIDGKARLEDNYSDLKDFFVTFLGVPALNLLMVFEQLITLGSRDASIQEVTTTIQQLNAFLLTGDKHPDPQLLKNKQIFPIREPSSDSTHTILASSEVDFAIVDNQPLAKLFEGKARLLAFTLKEVARLRPFISWMGLESRYLTRCVRQLTSVGGGPFNRISSPDWDISKKAHALLRIATHYNSPRVQTDPLEFYNTLLQVETWETDTITANLVLVQHNNERHEIEGEKAEVHITAGPPVKIYVPRDLDDREFSFNSKLAPRLTEWLMTDELSNRTEPYEEHAILVTQSVISSKNKQSGLSRILDHAGIVSIDLPNEIQDVDQSDRERIVSALPGPQGSPRINRDSMLALAPSTRYSVHSLSLSTSPTNSLPSLEDQSDEEEQLLSVDVAQSTFARLHTSSSNPLLSSSSVQAIYMNLLRKVVRAATFFEFPHHGLPNDYFDMSTLDNALTNDREEDLSILRSAGSLERDKMVGAAGELFVFEVLSGLNLPRFSKANWESSIRHYVNDLQGYTDLHQITETEIADIVYPDAEGVLTSFLISKGYLAENIWLGRRPRYLIEVKTTVNACSTRFYMSETQFQLIEASSNGSSGREHQETVYVIFRVFNLAGRSIGLQLYVDPWHKMSTRELVFTEKCVWSVVPGLAVRR